MLGAPHRGSSLFAVVRLAKVAISSIVFDGGIVDGKPVLELLSKLIEFSERVVDALATTV
jgi:hypothetical protein